MFNTTTNKGTPVLGMCVSITFEERRTYDKAVRAFETGQLLFVRDTRNLTINIYRKTYTEMKKDVKSFRQHMTLILDNSIIGNESYALWQASFDELDQVVETIKRK